MYVSLCLFSCDMSSSDENSTPATKKQKLWQRGSKMTARARAQQFNGVMEARGEQMWCITCGLRVDYKEKSTATGHVKYNSEHKRQGEQMKTVDHPQMFSALFCLLQVSGRGKGYA